MSTKSNAAASAAASSSSAAASPVDKSRLPSALGARGVNHSEKARWKTIYPIYINRAKKVSEGRKLPVALCIEKPSVYDIADMCTFLKLNYVIEVSSDADAARCVHSHFSVATAECRESHRFAARSCIDEMLLG